MDWEQDEQFENYVNYAGSKTAYNPFRYVKEFENYVNYAGSKTKNIKAIKGNLFENYVNYAGSKTCLGFLVSV